MFPLYRLTMTKRLLVCRVGSLPIYLAATWHGSWKRRDRKSTRDANTENSNSAYLRYLRKGLWYYPHVLQSSTTVADHGRLFLVSRYLQESINALLVSVI